MVGSLGSSSEPFGLPTAYWPSVRWWRALLSGNPPRIEIGERFEKQSFRNRCAILGPNGPQLLVVPLRHQGHRTTAEQRISYAEDWRKQHRKAIETAYGRSPFFAFMQSDIAALYDEKPEALYELNQRTQILMSQWLQVDLPTVHRSSVHMPILPETGSLIKEWPTPVYRQLFGERHGFVPDLSALDLMTNEGPGAYSVLVGL